MPDLAFPLDNPDTDPKRHARLDAQNWAILALSVTAACGLLWTAAHAPHPLVMLGAVLAFAFVGNTIFSLLHEAVHAKFAGSPFANALAGHLSAAFFPTSFTLQTALHLTHHRNNRSDVERFDYIGPDENVPLKTMQWFTILTGLYWVSIPLFWVFYAFFGSLVPWERLMPSEGRFARQTSAGAFLDSARKLPINRIRIELAASLSVQAALYYALDLTVAGWLACYFAFGLMWSSLQYADHAFSALCRHEGAWNLKVGRLTRAMFLNYHDHLGHHRDFSIRWQDLPNHAHAGVKRGWIAMLYLMWRGPRLLPGSEQNSRRARQLEWTVLASHMLVFAAAFQLLYAIASGDYSTRSRYFDVSLPVDALAPFLPLWSLAYVSIGPLLMVAALALRKPERTLPLLAALLIQLIVGFLCFLAFPVATMPVPAVVMTEFEAAVFSIADGINLTGNMMPSLHVAFAISAAWVAAPKVGTVAQFALWAWAAAICASTWLIHQHWVLDIVGGAMLAIIVMGVLHPWLVRQLARLETEFRPEAPAPAQRS